MSILRRTTVVALVAAVSAVAVSLSVPAFADPAGSSGSTDSLQTQLADAARGYNDAKGRLDAAKQRQSALMAQALTTEVQLSALTYEIGAVAAAAYKGGRLSSLTVLLGSGSADDFLARATTLEFQIRRDNRALTRLHATQATYAEQRKAIDAEVAAQQVQLTVMDQRKKQAEKALAAAGGGASGGPTGGTASATPAPRNPDGSWPKESCSVKDPTTSGCLTPRTLHALQQARAAGFTRYTACYRSGGSGEHPLGRACDFSSNATTFLNSAASGGDKAYGDRLAAWFVANADRLAVLYVIWYRQIWMASTGWRAYHGDGTPAGDHMNHVHLSVQ